MGRESRKHMLMRYNKECRKNLLAAPGIHPFVIVLDGLKASYNIPKIFRSAQAFGAREVHLVNISPFDPAPAKGAFRKVPARFFETFDESYQILRKDNYTIFTLEPNVKPSLPQTTLPEKSAFVLGHEEWGLSFGPGQYPDLKALSIPQCGQIQSLNVSVAASIVMYEYMRSR